MSQTAGMSEAEKWGIFQNIDAQCWVQVAAPAPAVSIWQLRDDWLNALFNGAYRSLRMNADPTLSQVRAVSFVTPDAMYEMRVFSRLRAGEYYDFKWIFDRPASPAPVSDCAPPLGDLERRAVRVARANGAGATGTANAVWLIHPSQLAPPIAPGAMNFRVFCPELDETIDFNLDSLDLRYQENIQEQRMRLVPWQRLLMWMARLQSIDSKAFGKIPKPLRSLLKSPDIQAQVAGLSQGVLAMWQQQGLLPPELAMITADDVGALRESVRLQQRLAAQTDFNKQFAQGCPIPKLLVEVDAAMLDPVDLQIFMTIGALREVHGFLEVETQRLLQRRPDLQAILQSPQGQRQLESDSEVASLRAHPQAVQEQQELQDVAWRKAGNYGPTARDTLKAQQQQLDMMQVQNMGMVNPLLGLAAAWQAEKSRASGPPAPPWKLYTPYLC